MSTFALRLPAQMVIVTLPAYNEEPTLPLLLGAIREVMAENRIEYRVVIVDDGSTDRTACIARKLAEEMPIAVIEHETNRGLGESLRTGLMYSNEIAEARDIIVTMDSDNTHNPGLIARMIRGVYEGNDVVIASRYRPGARVRGVPRYRRVLSFLGRVCFGLLFPTPNVRDFTSGYRAYRAGILKQAFDTYAEDFVAQSGFTCMVDILLKLRRLDAIMTEVPLVLRYDLKAGASKMAVLSTTVDTLKLLISRRFRRG